MEVVGCCRAVDNLDIGFSEDVFVVVIDSIIRDELVLVAELKVSLGPC